MKPLVVVHDVGRDATEWRTALAVWPGDAAAPDVVVEGASGDRTDVVWLLLEQMEAWRDRDPIILGCGDHGLAAETFALAGWVGGLVLLDGLGGEWATPDEQVAAQNEWLRAKFRTPDLVGYPSVWVESFARSLRANVHCPVLVIETPASITPEAEVQRRADHFAGPARIVRLDAPTPPDVVAAVRAWVGS